MSVTLLIVDVAILCKLYKVRCNLVHPLNGALSGQYVPGQVTRGALVVDRFTIGATSMQNLAVPQALLLLLLLLLKKIGNARPGEGD